MVIKHFKITNKPCPKMTEDAERKNSNRANCFMFVDGPLYTSRGNPRMDKIHKNAR